MKYIYKCDLIILGFDFLVNVLLADLALVRIGCGEV